MRHLSDEDLEQLEAWLEVKILQRLDDIVAAIDELNTAVTALQTAEADIAAHITGLNNDAAISAAATAISGVATALEALIPAAVVPPPPPPA